MMLMFAAVATFAYNIKVNSVELAELLWLLNLVLFSGHGQRMLGWRTR